jgi:hypothetical protein
VTAPKSQLKPLSGREDVAHQPHPWRRALIHLMQYDGFTGNTAYSIPAYSPPGRMHARELSLPRANAVHTDQQLSYKMSYSVVMADTITFRPDEDTSKALEVLTKDGTPVSAAVRTALIDAARRKASEAIRAEAERLAEDESDRAEAIQVLRDMETLRAW